MGGKVIADADSEVDALQVHSVSYVFFISHPRADLKHTKASAEAITKLPFQDRNLEEILTHTLRVGGHPPEQGKSRRREEGKEEEDKHNYDLKGTLLSPIRSPQVVFRVFSSLIGYQPFNHTAAWALEH